MDEVLPQIAAAVAAADPTLASEWYGLLGTSTPTADDPQWRELAERMTPAAEQAGVYGPEELMAALTAVDDPVALQGIIAAHVWPDADASDALEPQDAASAGGTGGAEAPTEEDPSAWNDFLIANGPAWDGSDESWGPFVEWFVYEADVAGVGRSARAFCEYATSNEPRAVFAQYGVAVGRGAAPAEADDVAALMQRVSGEILAEFRQQYPDLADIDDAEVLAILNDVVQQAVAS